MRNLVTYRAVTTLVGVGAMVLAAAGGKALSVADEGQTKEGAQTSQLGRDLVGTWILAGTPDRFDDPPPAKGPLKFFTGKHWTFTQADPATGKVVYHHGGTYALDGDNYVETFQYANENTTNLIGQTLKFKLKINGDTLVQVGVGNPYSQVWKRAK